MMKKPSQGQKPGFNFKVNLQKQLFQFKKRARGWVIQSKPFLQGRYWLIYLFSFGMGFYLFGPARGYQQLAGMKLWPARSSELSGIEALRQEVSLLKQDLKKLEQTAPVTEMVFNPAAFERPAAGQVVQSFGWINSGNTWKLNESAVLAVTPGSRIFAAAPGKVTEVKEMLDGSYRIVIDHGSGWESVYSNLAQALVQKEQQVIPQVVVGIAGEAVEASDRARFHFAIYHERQPADPEKILRGFHKQGLSD